MSVQWSVLTWEQGAVIMALLLSQIIFYLLFPISLHVLHPAGLNLSLLSSNFITLGAATAIFMYKVNITMFVKIDCFVREFIFLTQPSFD